MNTVIIFVKFPQPGHVKTRLGEDIGNQKAAELYRLFIDLTFRFVLQCAADQILVAVSPKEKMSRFVDEFRHPDFKYFAQEGNDLGQRLVHAFQTARESDADKTIIIGSDSPTLPPDYLDRAFRILDSTELVLGPARDGGYYLVGMKNVQEALFQNMEWSTDSVLQNTLQRAKQLDITYDLLPEWYDVDDVENLRRAAVDDASGKIKSFLSENLDVRL